MNFASYVIRRISRMALSLVAVSMITFTLLQMAPGSFADIQRISAGAGQFGGTGTEEMVDAFASRYGDDIPAWRQYLIFMRGALTWDFGPSYMYPTRDVQDIIAAGFPISATIAIIAVALSLLIAIPLGVFAALRQNSPADHGAMFLITLGTALPNYLTGIILMLIFTLMLGVLPSSGWSGPENMVMPILALVLGPTAVLSRYVRSSMLETLREEYVVAALAKGGRHTTVIMRHALRNSLIPIVTVLGPLLASLMTGTVFVEALFRIPGLGLYFAQAAASRDMPLLMGTALFFALILMTMNLLVDLVYGYLDPRIRAAGGVTTWRSPKRVNRQLTT